MRKKIFNVVEVSHNTVANPMDYYCHMTQLNDKLGMFGWRDVEGGRGG